MADGSAMFAEDWVGQELRGQLELVRQTFEWVSGGPTAVKGGLGGETTNFTSAGGVNGRRIEQ